jgi:hypothetical protein
MMGIVNDQVRFCHTISEGYYLDIAIGFAADALVAILAKNQRLPVLELYDVLAARVSLSKREPRAVIENVAILQDLYERRAFVDGRVL